MSNCDKVEPCMDKDLCDQYIAFIEGGNEPDCIRLTPRERRLQGK